MNGETVWVPTHILKEAAELAHMIEQKARSNTSWHNARAERFTGRGWIGTYIDREKDPNQFEFNLEGGKYNGTR